MFQLWSYIFNQQCFGDKNLKPNYVIFYYVDRKNSQAVRQAIVLVFFAVKNTHKLSSCRLLFLNTSL